MTAFETVIGFEVHTELKTDSKVFCGCSTRFGAPPNSNVCPVCLGMPGTLPVLNRKAFDLALRTAVALNCDIAPRVDFDRKNYYYPDLPKNYQISQNYHPLGRGGWIEIETADGARKRVRMNNIHLEEDAGKNIHPEGASGVDYTLVDLNRAGTPLLEIVSEPDLGGKEEADAFMKAMKSLLEYLDVSECKMEEGRLRFELNISVRPQGETKLGTKVEVKNLNSMSTVLKCIDAEFARQTTLIASGGRVLGETRLWDDVRMETKAMRSKETAHDYRYFPEPDLVDVEISEEWKEKTRAGLPELPLAKRTRFAAEYALPPYDARLLTDSIAMARYFEEAARLSGNPKAVSNWIMTEMLRRMNEMGEDASADDFAVRPEALAELVRLIDSGAITGKIAKQLFPMMVEGGELPSVLVERHGLKPVDDSSLEPIVQRVLDANPQSVADIQAGKMKAMGFLVGAIMKETKGKANPATVQPLLKKMLGLGD